MKSRSMGTQGLSPNQELHREILHHTHGMIEGTVRNFELQDSPTNNIYGFSISRNNLGRASRCEFWLLGRERKKSSLTRFLQEPVSARAHKDLSWTCRTNQNNARLAELSEWCDHRIFSQVQIVTFGASGGSNRGSNWDSVVSPSTDTS